MIILQFLLSLVLHSNDCDKKVLHYEKDFRVEYKLCGKVLTDTVYYYHQDKLLLKEHWNNGVSDYSRQTLEGSRMTDKLYYLRAALFDSVKLVTYDRIQSGKKTTIVLKNIDRNCNYAARGVLITKTENGIIVEPTVAKGDSVIVSAYFRKKEIPLIRDKVK